MEIVNFTPACTIRAGSRGRRGRAYPGSCDEKEFGVISSDLPERYHGRELDGKRLTVKGAPAEVRAQWTLAERRID